MTINQNVLPSQHFAVAAAIDPVSQGAGTVNSAWVSLADFEAIMAVVSVGVLGAAATVDAKVQQAQDASGTGAKDITGKAIAQLTKAGSDDNKQAIINCRSEELDVAGGFTHVRLAITVAVAASLIAGHVFGTYARYGPADKKDAASVDEIVA